MKTALAAVVLCAFAAAAAAQTAPAPSTSPAKAAPAAPAAQKPAEPRKPLILRLDEIDGPRMEFGPSPGESYQSKELPALGGDARALPTLPAGTSGSPFPRDAEKSSQDAR
jgi:hypothetical protein